MRPFGAPEQSIRCHHPLVEQAVPV